MRALRCAAAAIAAFSAAVSAEAKSLETQQFKANSTISIDPGWAYILIRSPGLGFRLLKSPSAADRASYAAERAAALAKAKRNNPRLAEDYAVDLAAYRQALRQGERFPEPERPIEPTEESFAFRSIDSDNFVTIVSNQVFAKSGPRKAYLVAVPPGAYRIYGQLFPTPNGSTSGFCMCMGSVQFDAAAGAITDMGTIHYPITEAAVDRVSPSWNGLTPGRGGLTVMRVEPASSATYMPPSLANLPHVDATYGAAGKIDNYFGVLIDRLTALPGVLSYRRDQVVDERTGALVGSN
jgi:hypothetical protein